MSDATSSHGGTDTEEDDNEFSRIADDERQSVTMAVEVDVSDMETEDVKRIKALSKLYEDSFMEIVRKNRDYSWSFLNTGEKLAMSDGTPFDQPVRSQAYGLLTRSGDKRERLIENIYGEGSASVGDEPWQTAAEASNYYFFLALILKHPELAKSISESR
jgi:hypothetical protein